MYGSNCKGAEDEGVSILHGNRGVYHDDKQPAFKVVYDAIHDVSIPWETHKCDSIKLALVSLESNPGLTAILAPSAV